MNQELLTEEDVDHIVQIVAVCDAWCAGDQDGIDEHAWTFLQIFRQDAEARAGHAFNHDDGDLDRYVEDQDAEYQRYAARMLTICHALVTPELRRELIATLSEEKRAEFAEIGRRNRLLSPDGIDSIRHRVDLGIGTVEAFTPN